MHMACFYFLRDGWGRQVDAWSMEWLFHRRTSILPLYVDEEEEEEEEEQAEVKKLLLGVFARDLLTM
jgi:hypothetical protein